MSKHEDRARAYHQAIKRALLEEWDPIGVKGIPDANYEYDAYVQTVYKMLISRQSRAEIFDYLWWLETQHMGLTGDRQATEKFADRLLEIPSEVESKMVIRAD